MDLSKYQKYAMKLYNAILSIRRYIEIEDENGITSICLDPSPLLKDISCKISVIKEDEEREKDIDINKQIVKYKIFCPPAVPIKKGDEVTIVKGDEKFIGLSGAPTKYSLNQEFVLIESKEA